MCGKSGSKAEDGAVAVERMLHMIRRVFGASVQGASHIRSGRECQDSFKKLIKDEDTVILAVADGHGSDACPYSKTGSYVAVNVFCKILGDIWIPTRHSRKCSLLFSSGRAISK